MTLNLWSLFRSWRAQRERAVYVRDVLDRIRMERLAREREHRQRQQREGAKASMRNAA